eukprot:7722207-Pyramimonas_sp.AAC.1
MQGRKACGLRQPARKRAQPRLRLAALEGGLAFLLSSCLVLVCHSVSNIATCHCPPFPVPPYPHVRSAPLF